MAKLTYHGKSCCVGKRGGVYLHSGKNKKYLSKKQRKEVKGNIAAEWRKKYMKIKIPKGKKKKGSGLLRPWGSPPGYSP